jgi:iron complex outermembrane receptor protein
MAFPQSRRPARRPMTRALRSPLFLALALALPAVAMAQDRNQDPRHDEVKDLDRVVVSASPLQRNAEDLIRPIEVLGGEALDNAKANSLGETVGRLPGVQASYFGPGVGRPIIRGLDGARVQVLSDGLSAGDVSTVSVDHAVSIEPFLANQIEVLKGPATLLYGSGAIGGAVNVVEGRVPDAVTAEPIEGRAEVRFGTGNDEKTAMARMDATAANGKLVFHIDGLHRETGDYDIPGYAEHAHEGDDEDELGAHGRLPNSFVRTDAGAFGVSYIGERGHLGMAASLFNTRYGIPGHGEAHHDDGDDDDDNDHGDEHGEERVTIRMDQRRTELRGGLRDLGVFDSLRVKLSSTDYTHTEYEGDEVGTVFESDTLEARAELVHLDWAGWDGAFGVQASQRDFVAIGDEAFVPASESRDTGLFWIGERAFGAVKLELGARYDRNTIDVNRSESIGPSRSFDATSLSAALRWNLSDDVHVSFGLDRAQRSPTAEELYSYGLHVATSSFEFGDPTLDVETANRTEAGLHWHRGGLSLGASLYYVDFDDYVYLADTGIAEDDIPARVWTQGDARFTGAEFDLKWTFLENAGGNWMLHAFGDIVRGRLTGSGTRSVSFSVPHDDDTHDYTADIALGGDLPRIAPARFGTELRWSNAHWRAGLGAVRYFDQNRTAEFEESSDGYTLVNADIAWHIDRANGNAFELFVNANNLLDEEARPHTSFLKELAPLPGRNVSFGVRMFF